MLALSNVLHVDPKELVERARLSTAVPIDISELTYDELDRRASRYFWAGDFRNALSVYDAMLEKVALDPNEQPEQIAVRAATLEVRRATALKRAGALLSAIATAERAIALSVDFPQIQADAYVVLADLQVQRGHVPLASDAAQRAIELSQHANPQTQGWAWMVRARVHYIAGRHDRARHAFQEARERASQVGDVWHMTHIEGNIGMCWLGEGKRDEARRSLTRAVQLAREYEQPALEASWLVELGKLALGEDRHDDADDLARQALEIAEPHQHHLTIFRAEWLRHLIAQSVRPEESDDRRLEYLRDLFQLLDQHEGVEEVSDYRKAVMRVDRGSIGR
jgi:tetratricopeptide (TPR) repeat protein